MLLGRGCRSKRSSDGTGGGVRFRVHPCDPFGYSQLLTEYNRTEVLSGGDGHAGPWHASGRDILQSGRRGWKVCEESRRPVSV